MEEKHLNELVEGGVCFKGGKPAKRQPIPRLSASPDFYSHLFEYLCCAMAVCEYKEISGNIAYCKFNKSADDRR